MYCIKNNLHKSVNISEEAISDAMKGVAKFKRQKGMRLTEKCVEHIGEMLIKKFPDDPENMVLNIRLKRPIIKMALYWFQSESLSYPLKSWMDKMYIQLLMSFDLIEDAVDYYE